MIDVERLEHDPDYWDECDPTGGEATHYREDATYVVWYRIRGGNREYLYACTGCTWVETESSGGKFIPRPTRKQWSGPEDGLPPVGTECEYFANPRHGPARTTEEWETGDILEVLAHRDKQDICVAVVFNKTRQSASTLISQCIRPLKSEKERVVDYWIERLPWPGKAESDSFVLSALYDLGALKMPEATDGN